jgi:hypothetical protein
MASLEDQVRAELDVVRGLSDAALKVNMGHGDQLDTGDVLLLLLNVTKVLMDVSVDLARAIDQLAKTGQGP